MSAAGTFDESRSRILDYGGQRMPIIGAHADHNRMDFVFPRAQSLMLRTQPWETRLKPLRCWSELATYAVVAMVGVSLMTALL